MGMSIDEAKQLLSQYQKLFNSLNGDYRLSQVQASELSHSIVTVLDAIRRYQMMELDRKADIVAMLEELQSEFKELDFFEGEEPINITQELMDEVKSWEYGVKDCSRVIQQKIDTLKGEQA